MYDRLPAPFGLVRFGVAPDHQKIKKVIVVYNKVARQPNFRFYGNVEFGKHVSLEDLKEYYHQICFTTGAQTDRRMGIAGEDLERSHAATEFVAWYNGHQDHRNRRFDLSAERVAVVGIGNVAVDVARILCRTPEELARTDIADYALEALRLSRVKEVYMLGRRGPTQAAFTNPEIKELGQMPGSDITVQPEEVELDPLSRAQFEKNQDRETKRKLEILQDYSERKRSDKPRNLTVRFLVSPVELIGNDAGQVIAMRLVKNELYVDESGTLRPKATERFEELPVDLVFRSVGYRGVSLPGVPFHDRWGIVPNKKGRVVHSETQDQVKGLYVSGWIKRGPSGVIGTNKPDAKETVDCMLEDLARGFLLQPSRPHPNEAQQLVSGRQADYVSYEDWLRLEELEVSRGRSQGRPRVKFTSLEEMLTVLNRAPESERSDSDSREEVKLDAVLEKQSRSVVKRKH